MYDGLPDFSSLALNSSWNVYEAARATLAELEAIPITMPGVDWLYVEERKQQFRAEIADFEQQFPDDPLFDDEFDIQDTWPAMRTLRLQL